jgi:CPA2 family monovalent cation:H+ antiporter-2
VVTVPAFTVAQSIIEKAKRVNEELEIIARSGGIEQIRALLEKGATAVVQPELEASLEITQQALVRLEIPASQTLKHVGEARRELYASVNRGEGKILSRLKSAGNVLNLNWFIIESKTVINECTIGELAIRTRTGASVVGVIRGSIFHPNPGPDFRFFAGDLVAVIGTDEQYSGFESWAALPVQANCKDKS